MVGLNNGFAQSTLVMQIYAANPRVLGNFCVLETRCVLVFGNPDWTPGGEKWAAHTHVTIGHRSFIFAVRIVTGHTKMGTISLQNRGNFPPSQINFSVI